MALQALKKRESFSDKAYHMLREAILTGELKPGDSLPKKRFLHSLASAAHRSDRRCSCSPPCGLPNVMHADALLSAM